MQNNSIVLSVSVSVCLSLSHTLFLSPSLLCLLYSSFNQSWLFFLFHSKFLTRAVFYTISQSWTYREHHMAKTKRKEEEEMELILGGEWWNKQHIIYVYPPPHPRPSPSHTHKTTPPPSPNNNNKTNSITRLEQYHIKSDIYEFYITGFHIICIKQTTTATKITATTKLQSVTSNMVLTHRWQHNTIWHRKLQRCVQKRRMHGFLSQYCTLSRQSVFSTWQLH